jgi:hypothetical protein
MGVLGSCPAMNRHAAAGPAMGWPYVAVGMQRALDSGIGLPRRSTSASLMLVFVMPADVRRNLMGCSFVRGVCVVLSSETQQRRKNHRSTRYTEVIG